jgi:transposase
VFGLGLATKIYVAVEAVAMRKGFEGLYGLVRDQLCHDPLSGHPFLFTYKTKDQTRFCIPIRCCRGRVPLASAAWEEGSAVQADRSRRRVRGPRGHG